MLGFFYFTPPPLFVFLFSNTLNQKQEQDLFIFWKPHYVYRKFNPIMRSTTICLPLPHFFLTVLSSLPLPFPSLPYSPLPSPPPPVCSFPQLCSSPLLSSLLLMSCSLWFGILGSNSFFPLSVVRF